MNTHANTTWKWRPNIDWVRAFVAPVLVFIATSLDRGYQTDFWQHLARGRAMAQRGALLNADLATFTIAGRAYRDNNWLTQLLYYRLYERGGINLVQFVNSLVLAAAVGVLVWLCRRVSGSMKIAAAAGVFAFFGLWQALLIRPQTFSLLMFVVMYAVLNGARRRARWLLAPPILMALWANVHGGFAIGLLLIGSFAVAEAWEWLFSVRPANAALAAAQARENIPAAHPTEGGWRAGSLAGRFVICLAISFLATLLNPYGWHIYQYAGELSRVGIARGIEEWLPPSPTQWAGKVFLASLVLLPAFFLLARRRPTRRELCLVVCFLLPACQSVRMVAWWMLAIIPVMAALAGEWLRRDDRIAPPQEWRFAAAGALGAMLLAAVWSVPWLEHYNPVLGNLRPAHRVDDDLQLVSNELATKGSRRVFSRLEWGNFLSFSLPLRSRVFMDARIELYPDDIWSDYMTVTRGGAGWREVLERYSVDTLVLDRTYHRELLRQLRHSSDWGRERSAGDAVVFARRGTARGGRDAVAGAGDF